MNRPKKDTTRNRKNSLLKEENVIFDSAECGYPEGVDIHKFLKALQKARAMNKKVETLRATSLH